MHAPNDYKVLRVIEDTSQDDPDFAAIQSVPENVVVLQPPLSTHETTPVRLKVELFLEWLDGRGSLVTTDRGSFELQVLRVVTRRAPLEGDAVIDSAVLVGQMSHRPIVVDDLLPGDRFAVRISRIARPPDAEQARILYREFF